MSTAPATPPASLDGGPSAALAPWVKLLRRAGWEPSRKTLGEPQLFLLLAVIIGLFSGLAVVLFRIAIDWTRLSVFGPSLTPPWSRLLLVPTLGGLAVAYLVIKFFPRVRGSGVNQTKAAMYIYDGFIPFNTVIGKFITCALAIGSGQSLGPEDPSLQMGAGIASALGRRLRLSREKIRLIAPVGAAAGLAAAFNAPISAVLFVIEEVIGKWTAGVLGAIVLSAVSSVVVVRWFLGEQPLFRVPAYHLVHPTELLAYAALGIIGGVTSLVFAKLVTFTRHSLKALLPWTHYFQPAVAGCLVGLIGIWLPQVMGAGYQSMDEAMHDQFAWRMLVLLGAFKILATTISFSSGTPGGMFAPTLFVGAMLGGAVGTIEHHFLPWLTGSVGAYALVGMGTLFAGFLRAPMTSVFMVLEVSGNYSIILPVMISNTLAYLISRKYEKTPIFDALSRDDGLDLPSMEERREESTLHVEDAMRPYRGPILDPQASVNESLLRVTNSPETVFLALDESGKWSTVKLEDLRDGAAMDMGLATVGSLIPSAGMPYLHPDEVLDVALRRIGDFPFLPVVNRTALRKLEGVVSVADILRAYRAAQVSREG